MDIVQQEADTFYRQICQGLLSSMERKRNEKSPYNFEIVEEYICGVREIYIMFRKEYYRYENLFKNQLNYLGQSLEQIKDLYRKFSTHQYLKINRGMWLRFTRVHISNFFSDTDFRENRKRGTVRFHG